MNDLSSIMNVMNDLSTDPAEARRFVYSVVRRIVRDPDDAGDVAQDALVLAHRHRASFRGRSSYRTWLYRIATTTALGHLRRRRRSREDLLGGAAVAEAVHDPAPSPADHLASRQDAERLHSALATLNDDYRAVVMLRADALTEAEVAQHLGLSVANVKIRAFRARQRLRETLLAG